MKNSAVFAILALSAFVLSCAPPFETRNSKPISASANDQKAAEAEQATFEVKPAISNASILKLPSAEQRVGKGKNTVHMGRLEIEKSQVSRLEDGKLIKFTGKGKLLEHAFEISLSGKVDATGRAQLFPLAATSHRQVRVRGIAVCLDIVAEAFKCRSLFIDIYVRLGSQTYTQQFQMISSSGPVPQPLAPPKQQPVQELPVELTPEQELAQGDHEMEVEPAHEGEDGTQRTGRFVGYQEDVDGLFQLSALPPGLVLDEEDNGTSAQSPPAELTPDPAKATGAAAATATGEPSEEEQLKAQEEMLGQLGAHTLVPPKPGTKPTDKPTPKPHIGGLVFSFKPPADSTSQQSATPAPKSTPQVAAKPPAAPKASKSPTTPAKVIDTAPSEQSRGCYSSRGLGPQCNGGGILRNASALPMSGLGFKFLYPQRQMWFGTKYLIDVIIDMGKKMSEILPGYSIPIYDLSSQYGSFHPPRKDGGHQNGLEADIGFVTTTSPPPMVVIVQNGVFKREIVKMDEQLKIWKHVVKVNAVSKIFVDQVIKRAFCNYARALPQDPDTNEALRKLRHAEGHRNHWHLRLKCPPSSPRCQDDPPVPAGSGC